MTRERTIHLGYEIPTGIPIAIPVIHTAVTGMTQQSGKTTTLEAMVERSGVTALTFVTKRGEKSFTTGNRIAPYFRDRADWQFVTSIIDATLQEKNRFLRPWIMKICRTTKSLRDVQAEVRKALKKATGISEGVYTQLDAYLDLIVPEIDRSNLASQLYLRSGLNVMDVRDFTMPMQMLFIQSALDWVNDHCRDTVVVIPEAWEFIPEGKGSPVKASAITLARKGAGIGNFIWVDSQDMAGVDKTILRACTVWLIGVQREANEIKRNLSNIPASIARPGANQIAHLERGQFFVCFGRNIFRTYIQPTWASPESAKCVATGLLSVDDMVAPKHKPEEPAVDKAEAERLREENAQLTRQVAALSAEITALRGQLDPVPGAERQAAHPAAAPPAPTFAPSNRESDDGCKPIPATDIDAIYAEIKRRAGADPGVLKLLAARPEIEVTITRPIIKVDHEKQPGIIAGMISEGFFQKPVEAAKVVTELKRRGRSVHHTNVYRDLNRLAEQGFLTIEDGGYQAVEGMKVRIVEA